VFSVYGPEDGRRNDITLYSNSNMDEILSGCLLIDGGQYCVYGDPAYMLRPHLQVGYPGLQATPEQHAYNMSMSSERIAFEWFYKDLKQNFTTLDFKRKLKVNEAPIGLLFMSSVLLWNFKI
jgi:DDE superfamily endonuclease